MPIEPDAAPMGPACSDNIDNDGDGKIDFPNDPGCVIAQADDERDNCPSGADCPQCGNGIDDNNDGLTDYPEDPGCDSAADDSEFLDNPNACGIGLKIKALPPSGSDMGMLDDLSTSMITTTCGGGGGASAVAYLFHLAEPKVMIASTNLPGTTTDTVLNIRGAACEDPAAHIACNDNVGTATGSSITQSLAAGSYYLIVGGKTVADVGSYQLQVQFFAGEGSTCTAQPDCGPGLVCRIPVGSTQMICTQPVCNDSIDDDGDGKIDFPADPGCQDPQDGSETDDCPSGPMCPACGDGIDNDGDGDIDYPADTACASASANSEACAGELDPIIAIMTPTTMSTLVGTTNEHNPSCGSTNDGPDRLFTLQVPALDQLVMDTNGSVLTDTVLSFMNSTCAEPSIECDDDDGDGLRSLISRTNVAAGTYVIAVDAYSTSTTLNPFLLNVSGIVKAGESCESALFQSGALICSAGYACSGTMGARTCAPAACNDGIDNNGNGQTDYPADVGCTSLSDNVEDDVVCPGAMCPACSDTIDNDGDGFIDYPADIGCLAASSDNEGCAGELDPIADIVAPTTLGTLVGASDDHDPTCTTANGADLIYKLQIPTMAKLTIDTKGSVVDTVLTLKNASCSGTIQCDNNGGGGTAAQITRNFVAGGTYMIVVDANTTTPNTFVLNVSGQVTPGTSCEGALFQAGAFTCTDGYACKGIVGARTCRSAECLDGIDNNLDGVMDFPNDPGCESPSDDAETTVCPGALCPVCSDGIDNDGDGQTDFPADFSCFAASSQNEACSQGEPVELITTQVTTGTTIGAFNDYTPTCGSSTHSANDVALQLELPGTMATLSLNLTGFDTAHSLLDATCGSNAPIACSDPALMALTNISAGTYYVMVEGWGSTNGDWSLTTTGTVAAGQSCEGALFAAGAFTCTTGFACEGAVGSRTCAPAACNDGIDNNMDGLTDYPADPGCDSPSDGSETTVCPGPSCPVCSDGIDNDGDGLIDYPADPSCSAASGTTEHCSQSEPIALITQQVTSGTTVGAGNEHTPTCGSSSHTAGDLILQLPLPPMESLTLNLTGFDTAHTLLDSTCSNSLRCSDPPLMTHSNLPGGDYFVVVEGWGSGTGAWSLTTTGTIAPGGSCEGALFAAGAFTCGSGLACVGPAGMRTCFSECSDGVDNNMDGKIDYPADPGCASPADAVEDTACPGAGCPMCSNTMDDDSDMLVDYPLDFGCAAAGSATEVFCPVEVTAATLITTPQTAGMYSGADNYEQSCDTTTGVDVAYGLQLPVPVKLLVIDTLGSTVTDTVVSFWDASCTRELGCDANGAPGTDNRSVLNVANVAPGNYAIQVDSGSTTLTTGAFLLNVKGTVAPGTVCTDPLFAAGVLVCPMGTTCNGTCQ